MSGEHVVLTIELQLCLVMALTPKDMKSAREAKAAEDDGTTSIARPGRRLQPPVVTPCGLSEVSSPVRTLTTPAQRARLAP